MEALAGAMKSFLILSSRGSCFCTPRVSNQFPNIERLYSFKATRYNIVLYLHNHDRLDLHFNQNDLLILFHYLLYSTNYLLINAHTTHHTPHILSRTFYAQL